MTMNTDSLTQAVRGAHAALAAARNEHAAGVEALKHGRETLTHARAELDRLTALDRAAVTRHAARMEERARAGNAGPLPQLAPSAKQVAGAMVAQATHAAALEAVSSLEAAEARAREGVAAAEREVERAVDAMLDAEAIQAAEGILRGVDEVLALGRRLPNRLNVPLSRLRDQPHVVQRAQSLIEKLLPSDLDTPLSELGGPSIAAFRAGDASYEQRRSALIRGDAESLGEPAPAAQAG